MAGSVGAPIEGWPGLVEAIDQPTGGPGGVTDTGPGHRDLTWQTTVGQIIFLESVVPDSG